MAPTLQGSCLLETLTLVGPSQVPHLPPPFPRKSCHLAAIAHDPASWDMRTLMFPHPGAASRQLPKPVGGTASAPASHHAPWSFPKVSSEGAGHL